MEVARVLRLDLLIKLSLAVLLGGIIGFERELSGKPAGLRTNILICLGAALLMDISTRIGLVDGHRIGDPARIAAQVVSGVGFLGAGTIMQGSGVVTGLTSAATIWVVAAIGLTVGGGLLRRRARRRPAGHLRAVGARSVRDLRAAAPAPRHGDDPHAPRYDSRRRSPTPCAPTGS